MHPIYCTHEDAKVPARYKRDKLGRVLLARSCSSEASASAPWCKDGKGRPREHAPEPLKA